MKKLELFGKKSFTEWLKEKKKVLLTFKTPKEFSVKALITKLKRLRCKVG